MFVVARDVLEPNAKGISRQSVSGAFGPFNQDDLATVDNVIPTQIREVLGTAQPIKVDVVDGCAFGMMLIHERERGTCHVLTNSQASADCLRQCRLSRAEFAFESDKRGGRQAATQAFTPSLQLVTRDS